MQAIQNSPTAHQVNYLPLVEPIRFDGPAFETTKPANTPSSRRPNIVAKRARRDARIAARRA